MSARSETPTKGAMNARQDGRRARRMQLPQTIEPAFFDQVFRVHHAAWHDAILEVCATHEIPCESVAPFPDGSNLVAEVNQQLVVKIFPAFHHHQWESERRALAHLGGTALPLRIPTLIAQGKRDDGWLYVVMGKVPGAPLSAHWDEIGAHDRVRLAEKIGSTMAAVHRVPLGDLSSLPPEWDTFLDAQLANCGKRHASQGVPQWFEQGLDNLLREWAPNKDSEAHVLLTGEYTPFNLLVQRNANGWQLTGMIDFGDAMVGPRDYDFLGPTMFTCRGEPALVAALFRGYFGENLAMTRQRRMRFMALAVLHRYANFNVQLCIPGWRERVASFEALAELTWP